MYKTTILAIASAALAIACDRPTGEDSAADLQDEKPELERAVPPADETRTQQPTAQPGQPAATGENVRRTNELRVAEITRDPDARVDQMVVVVGEVKDMLGTHAFKLNDEAPLAPGADDDIVVLGTERAQWTIDDTKGDARLRVSGKLTRVPAANLERQLGWKFDDKLKSAVQDERVVLIAQSVERLEGGEQQRAAERGDTQEPGEREPVRGEQPSEREQQPERPLQP